MKFTEEIIRLEKIGYIHPPKGLIVFLRNKEEFKNIQKFKMSNGSMGHKNYSCFDLFGCISINHIYKIDKEENFVNFLVGKFFSQNPNPKSGIKKAFTRLLHENGLHWEGEKEHS